MTKRCEMMTHIRLAEELPDSPVDWLTSLLILFCRRYASSLCCRYADSPTITFFLFTHKPNKYEREKSEIFNASLVKMSPKCPLNVLAKSLSFRYSYHRRTVVRGILSYEILSMWVQSF